MSSEPPRREEPRVEPPRRGGARREQGEAIPLRREGGRSRISDARGYTPRGRTVRETGAGSRDSFRPALELVREPGAGTRRGQAGRPSRSSDQHDEPARSKGAPAPASTTRSFRSAAAPTRRRSARRDPDETPRSGRSARRDRDESPRSGRTGSRGTGAGKGGRTRAGGRPAASPALRQVVRRQPARLAEPARRLRLGAVFVMVLFTLLAGRLVMLQMTDAGNIARTGLEDRLASQPIFAPRGAIYDQGRNVLAQSVEARLVFADPSMIEDSKIEQTVVALRDLLGVPASELRPKLLRKTREDGSKDEFEYLKRGISLADADRVTALNIKGIGVARDEIRVQPGVDLAANLIGYTGGDGRGKQGLEGSEDELLYGADGKRVYEVGNGDLSTQIPGGYEEVTPAHPGTSLELTIDRDVQYTAQQMLLEQMTKVNAVWACAIVMDVKTGDIRAQASYPTYSAANPAGSTPAQQTDNCTQTVADPGSVHKVVTLGALLETGTITPDTTVTVCPSVRKGDQTYSDTHPFSCGTKLTLPGLLAFSSNVGTINLAAKLGDKEAATIYDFQRRYGLGQRTNEGLPNEAAGALQKPDQWRGSSFGSVPIGDGIAVTPLQMTAVYNTIANNGTYVTPRLIQATIGPDGKEKACPAAATHPVLSPANAQALRQDLEAVVTVPGATGRSAAIPGYRVAGKTGTGQFVGPDGHYLPGEVASFIGMVPADNPRYVVSVFAFTPGGNGGQVAGPGFKSLMSYVLGHYQTPPTGTNPPTFATTG
jgi:cell division protein FtsI (penicillin-binding protein 3)